jgi:hypothetical protein
MATRSAHRLGVLTIAVGIATLAIGVSVAAGSQLGSKSPNDPWSGLTDQQKQSAVDDAHRRNVQFLESFEANKGDPRSLPVIRISTYGAPTPSLGAAAQHASQIIRGRVQSVHFIANPAGAMPTMEATVAVKGFAKGSGAPVMRVMQSGGPVAQQGNRGALAELEEEPLILPGDDVVLLLNNASVDNTYRTATYGGCVFFVKGGLISGPTAERYGIAGQQVDQIWSALRNPQIAANAYPMRTTPES